MSTSDSQSYCLRGFTCKNYGLPSCSFKDDGRTFSTCEAFKPAFIAEKLDDKELFAVTITRREFLLLPIETRRRILLRQVESFLGEP